MQINKDQARICILAIERAGITESPEHDEAWSVHEHLTQGIIMDSVSFSELDKETQIHNLLEMNSKCARLYHKANDLQGQSSDDVALYAAAADFESAVREALGASQ